MFSNCFTIQLIEALQLTSIRDRPWRVQPCSALLNDGIDVSFLFKVYNYYYSDFALTCRRELIGFVKMFPLHLSKATTLCNTFTLLAIIFIHVV